MKRKRFSVEQIVAILKRAEMGMPEAELIRRVGITDRTFYRWKKQFTGLEIDQVRQLKQLQDEKSIAALHCPFSAATPESLSPILQSPIAHSLVT